MDKEREALAYAEHEVNQERGHDISKDDILNLKIELETTESVEDFLGVLK